MATWQMCLPGICLRTHDPEPCDLSELNRAIDRVQKVDPKLAFFIIVPAGDFRSKFRKSAHQVFCRQIPTRLLSNLQVWVGNPQDDAARTGQPFSCVASDRPNPATVTRSTRAVDFVAYQITGKRRKKKQICLIRFRGREVGGSVDSAVKLFAARPGRKTFGLPSAAGGHRSRCGRGMRGRISNDREG